MAVGVMVIVFLAVLIKRHFKEKPVLDISASFFYLTEDTSKAEEGNSCPDLDATLAAEPSLPLATPTPPSPFFPMENDGPSSEIALSFQDESQPSIHDTVNLTVTNDFADESSQGINLDAECFPAEQPRPVEREKENQRDSAKDQDSGVEFPDVNSGDVEKRYSRISLLPEVQPPRASKKIDVRKAPQDQTVGTAAMLQPLVPVNTFHGVFFNYHGGCDWFFFTERRKKPLQVHLRDTANSSDWKPRCKLSAAAAAEADSFLAITGFQKGEEPYRMMESGKMLHKQLEDSGRWQKKVAEMEKTTCGCRRRKK